MVFSILIICITTTLITPYSRNQILLSGFRGWTHTLTHAPHIQANKKILRKQVEFKLDLVVLTTQEIETGRLEFNEGLSYRVSSRTT